MFCGCPCRDGNVESQSLRFAVMEDFRSFIQSFENILSGGMRGMSTSGSSKLRVAAWTRTYSSALPFVLTIARTQVLVAGPYSIMYRATCQ